MYVDKYVLKSSFLIYNTIQILIFARQDDGR